MRVELIHPMLVHFPIALFTIGVLVRIAAAWADKRPKLSFLLPAAWMILSLGVIAAWATVIAGNIAREIVEPTLQNTKVLDEHEEHALITASCFTIGVFLDFARAFLLTKWRLKGWLVKRGLGLLVWFLYLFSLTNLIIAGAYGGYLVYEEGAAVNPTPSP